MLVAAWEWGVLAGLSNSLFRFLYVAFFLILSITCFYFVTVYKNGMFIISFIASLWWCFVLVNLIKPNFLGNYFFITSWGRLLSGLLIITPGWVVAYYLHLTDEQRPLLLFLLVFIVWTADTAAYFIGRKFGRHRLAPSISPGKTVEGAIGGIFSVVLLALIYNYLVTKYAGNVLAVYFALVIIVTVFSMVGDLVESKFKRIAGVKDSGVIMPGHGGVLDRIDAYTCASPIFMFGWFILSLTRP